MPEALPRALRPPLDVVLARAADTIPKPEALPGGCLYEPKWDGYRVLAFNDAGDISIWSRQRKNLTRFFPDLVAALAGALPPGCIIDGEAVVWTEGRLDFEALQDRLTAGRRLAEVVRGKPAHFVAFDLLAAAGHDARSLPLRDRRALLEELATGWEPPLALSPVADYDTAQSWFTDMAKTGVEGLVIKGAGQPYDGGERRWIKVKHRRDLNVICGAVTGSRARPREIIAGLWLDGRLRIVGRTSPLAALTSASLGKLLVPAGEDHPWPEMLGPDRFGNHPEPVKLIRVEPLVIEVSADAAWNGRSFRHPLRYLRAQPEMDPAEVQPPA